ncbi:TetR/AcrR family transcriptional regulator [Spirillospora sp. NPDC047279]|uniref:TetR/AcrR family transcriptional regulator n=1 Tax=Spirillospora sp. NPDC047279 TaxID=3155478 RepID=UPI0033C7C90E
MARHRSPSRTGRPREARVDEAITSATRELLAEAGHHGLTMDAVARRAGIGKAAIYRRYATKQEMVLAAAVEGTVPATPDTGSLLGDLTVLAETVVARLSHPAASNGLLGLLGELGTDAALAGRFAELLIEPERAGDELVLRRAVDRGELAAMPDVELFHAVFGGAVLSWIFVSRLDPADLPARLARFTCAALRAER